MSLDLQIRMLREHNKFDIDVSNMQNQIDNHQKIVEESKK